MTYNAPLPAVEYYMIVRQYAFAHGMPFFYAKDQKKAIEHYEYTMTKLRLN